MTRARDGAAAGQEPPPDVKQAHQLAERQQQLTSAVPAALRRRREAAWRLSPLADRCRDPLDALAGRPANPVEWGGYDVITLGLNCPHGDSCTARHKQAV